ncbi:copper oxidase (plasmid) [Haloferax mediterranei ATCC 33500]|uniref:Copper-containing nitrite reductase n=1 Tax=Haloferax mediterranei (strain ATCC 33500 / DSM 1411 / JCM 8866 / NBRC 14739 / NCIMB 2177 / R-4) TaxID=523841 RepID=I3RA07_HALMT|nr:multicopper oxidase domain-containing protein [Haloferax mediterranei]AFK21067.1 nitrite reductase copper containing protein [Haloferax mediterranei ATCC 33500]AHZ24077.1 multicopper oxidase [Haloferax mediterranei ATCC 33500]EMA05150.1 nitrite reductase copper containing protein [Haloferax mediterranei ATCC 33500]MDX5989774.1 multicopper oxidase domain-containing protein [Haloferax mediterranei ATCC 33500]QCQ77220.1 copper oxidase [Haloferax mediterranei ATCC 33500]
MTDQHGKSNPPTDEDEAASLTKGLEERLVNSVKNHEGVTRRAVLGGLAIAGSTAITGMGTAQSNTTSTKQKEVMGFGAPGEYTKQQFNPHGFLREFNTGDSTNQRDAIFGRNDYDLNAGVYEENGQTVREFNLVAVDVEQEILPGVTFPMWTYNGQVPGPTLRAEEGDLIRVNFTNGSAKMDHTIHPHLRNLNPRMDGIPQNGPGLLKPGESFTYEWQAQPVGTHLYHCHTLPLKAHVHRGLYGTIIIDPKPEKVRENPRKYIDYHGPITEEVREMAAERARSRNMVSHADYAPDGYDGVDEMVMVMNGFDTNFNGDNEVYGVNTRGFCYAPSQTDAYDGEWKAGQTKKPIQIDTDELQRVHLVNMIEFDFVNSFHTHSQFFDYYDAGTTLFPNRKTIDTVLMCQAQRGVIELDYGNHQPGLYMFHAHQSEFAELGWMSFFEVN